MERTERPRRREVGNRWPAHPAFSLLLRGLVLVVPIAAGALTAGWLARTVPRPAGGAELLWWAGLLAAATLGATLVDRLARRLLPLAVLLQLSLLFPDRAPSRFRVARAAGSPRVLERRIQEARRAGVDDDPARAAEAILELVAALSSHDRKTRGHSERVRAFTDLLAEAMKVPQEGRDRLRWAALLHDIGKLRVPAEVLNKPGKPDEHEWELLKAHPTHGADIAAPLLPWLEEWGDTIGQHHERYDGRGYPNGLGGEEICLGARIVTVADSFEVMTAARSYKRPMSPTAARRELASCAGTQFDPKVVRALFNVSLGRLRWVIGPASWFAQLPFVGGASRAGGEVVAALKSAAVAGSQALLAAAVGLAGVMGLPAAAQGEPGEGAHPVVATTPAPAAPAETGGNPAASDGNTDTGPEPARSPDPDPTAESSPRPETREEPKEEPAGDPVRDTIDSVEDIAKDAGNTVGGAVDDVTGTVEDTASSLTRTTEDVVRGILP